MRQIPSKVSGGSSTDFVTSKEIVIGGVDVVCQPDGYCIANGKTAVVEIKSPMYGHYTSQATVANPEVRGQGTAKTATDRRKIMGQIFSPNCYRNGCNAFGGGYLFIMV